MLRVWRSERVSPRVSALSAAMSLQGWHVMLVPGAQLEPLLDTRTLACLAAASRGLLRGFEAWISMPVIVLPPPMPLMRLPGAWWLRVTADAHDRYGSWVGDMQWEAAQAEALEREVWRRYDSQYMVDDPDDERWAYDRE